MASPFKLLGGSSVYATVTAINLFGSSGVSNPGNGAVISSKLFIQPYTLNAVIKEEAILTLYTIADVKYVIISKPKFEVTVNSNELKVKSLS